jgi:hypothetical protein
LTQQPESDGTPLAPSTLQFLTRTSGLLIQSGNPFYKITYLNRITKAYSQGNAGNSVLISACVSHVEHLEDALHLCVIFCCVHVLPRRTVTTQTPYVSIRQHTSAYVSIRQHTSAYVSTCVELLRRHGHSFMRLEAYELYALRSV